MNMKSTLLFALLTGFISMNAAIADDETQAANNACPSAYQTQIETEFGAGTAANTTCITQREEIKVVMNMSTSVLNPKSGISQTINNVYNMIGNYEGVYGMTFGDQYKIVIVAHFAGARFLLSDAAYNKTYGVTTGNPSRAAVEGLLAKGVPIYMCQNTMRANAWMSSDLIPGVQEVPGGVVALADYALRKWAVLTP